jgi:hypothetical protein
VLNTGLSGTAFLDEDNMASNSATKAASQQSIKAYVDNSLVRPRVSLTKSSVQSIATSAATAITWDGEVFDTDTMHDNSTNPERITIKTAGIYLLIFNGGFDDSATANGLYRIANQAGTVLVTQVNQAGARSRFSLSCIVSAEVDNWFAGYAFQETGGALNFETTANRQSSFMAIKLA